MSLTLYVYPEQYQSNHVCNVLDLLEPVINTICKFSTSKDPLILAQIFLPKQWKVY